MAPLSAICGTRQARMLLQLLSELPALDVVDADGGALSGDNRVATRPGPARLRRQEGLRQERAGSGLVPLRDRPAQDHAGRSCRGNANDELHPEAAGAAARRGAVAEADADTARAGPAITAPRRAARSPRNAVGR